MKKILLSLMVLCCALAGKAQATTDVPKAVLQHGDQVSAFTGGNAFVQAMAAAVDGDVITLSNGNFVPAPINKSVSIYGAGYQNYAETGTTQSSLNGNVFIGASEDTLCNVHMEGLYINGVLYAGYANNTSTRVPIKGLNVEKCFVQGSMYMGGYNENLILKQCVIASTINRGLCKNTLFTNCLLFGTINGYTEDFEILIDHSMSTAIASNDNGRGITWTNCIFTTNENYTNLIISGTYCVVKNCIKTTRARFGTGTSAENIYEVGAPSEIFADGENANYSAGRTWELQQPDVWIGTDGTPIGPSGGIGWSTVPRVPFIKSLELNVEGQQLNINYEAEARD
ncbi:MAG: hypothetical protein IKW85_13025 [Muribaculaceae bacterium]|nr:hypothetical protein [Muribaculaceae bacterium]